MSLGLTRPPLADSMMLTLTSHYTATNAKHHRYAATNLPAAADGDAPRAAQIGAVGRRDVGRAGRSGDDGRGTAGCPGDGPLDRPRREWSLSSVARAKRLLAGMQEIRDASGTAGRAAARQRDGSRPVTWAKAMAVETG